MTDKLKLTSKEQSWMLNNILMSLAEQIKELETNGNMPFHKELGGLTEKKAKMFWNKLIDLDVIQHYSNAKNYLGKYDLNGDYILKQSKGGKE